MKAKVREAKSNLSLAELLSELKTARERRFRLQFRHRVSRATNPLELRTLRRDIARLNTWIRAKRPAEAA